MGRFAGAAMGLRPLLRVALQRVLGGVGDVLGVGQGVHAQRGPHRLGALGIPHFADPLRSATADIGRGGDGLVGEQYAHGGQPRHRDRADESAADSGLAA